MEGKNGSNFHVSGVGSAGLKNFGLDSVGPKYLSWVARMTWVEILVWVVWVRKTFGLSQKKKTA